MRTAHAFRAHCASDAQVGPAVQVSAATGGFFWMLLEYGHKGKPSIVGIVRLLFLLSPRGIVFVHFTPKSTKPRAKQRHKFRKSRPKRGALCAALSSVGMF